MAQWGKTNFSVWPVNDVTIEGITTRRAGRPFGQEVGRRSSRVPLHVKPLRPCRGPVAVLLLNHDAVLRSRWSHREVRWYFVPDDTPFLDGFHLFGSNNWLDATRQLPTLVGEVDGASRPWANGAKPPSYDPDLEPCNPQWFLNGSPVALCRFQPIHRDCRYAAFQTLEFCSVQR